MVRTNSLTNQCKIFELSKVRFKDVKTYGYKTGFIVEVHVLNDNSKRVTVIWDGDDHADSKLFRVTDLIAVECEKGGWAFFFTEAQTDTDLYENAITSSRKHINDVDWCSPLEKRREGSKKLLNTQRAVVLRDHPMLSARLHVAQQDVFWQYVVHGTFKPFDEVKDYWRRVEFQERGTPHSHYLINIATVAGGIQVAS
jgi:hypothetical protein